MSNWTFSIRWLDAEHILLSFTKDESKHDIAMTIKEYTEFMELAQTFNMQFKDRIDDAILQHYLNG
jgi:hypothetical protein